jgi:hypothetical protein
MWIDVTLLRDFLRSTPAHISLSTPSNLVHVKIETNPPSVPPPTAFLVKLEPVSMAIPHPHAPIKMRTLNDGGHEIIELLSDSESDGAESGLEVTDVLMHGASRSSSPIPQRLLSEIDVYELTTYNWLLI